MNNIEQSILGALITYPHHDSVYQALTILDLGQFENPDNYRIFQKITELRQKEIPTDLLTLNNEFKKDGENINALYLTECVEACINPASTYNHALILFQEWSRKKLIDQTAYIGTKLQNNADVPEMVSELETLITEINERVRVRKGREMGQISDDLIYQLTSIINGKLVGIPTNILTFDRILNGWKNTDLHIIAGRPAMGKTDFALFSALQSAKQGFKTGFISLEMNDITCLSRLTAMNSGFYKDQFISQIPKSADEGIDPEFKQAIERTANAGVIIKDLGSANIEEITSVSRELVRNGCELIVIDYLGLIDLPQGKSTSDGLGSISRALKSKVAKDLNVPVIALHQLNRKCEETPDKRPIMSHLRGSGDIEQDASSVTFLYRPEYYGFEVDEDGNSTAGKCELITVKNRHGRTGTAHTLYKPEKGVFNNWAGIGQKAPNPLPSNFVPF